METHVVLDPLREEWGPRTAPPPPTFLFNRFNRFNRFCTFGNQFWTTTVEDAALRSDGCGVRNAFWRTPAEDAAIRSLVLALSFSLSRYRSLSLALSPYV